MPKQIYINLPVRDLKKATEFYEKLGFVKNPDFSDENGSGMTWSKNIYVMLLTYDFYKKFLKGKEIADTTKTSGTLVAISLESKEAVQKFADTAKQNGGDYFQVDMGVPEDVMFGYEVLDPDGNQLEPVWMSPDFNPKA